MTARKHLKQIVRARMSKTGESYTTARRQVVRQAPTAEAATRWHFPGRVPATTALRALLAHAGVRNPRTGEPFSEAMLFGIAGGIGVGVFSFLYEKQNFASFFVAGRHRWQDNVAYLREAATRFGLKATIRETGGARSAANQLREALDEGPCIAWVDLTRLPHRGATPDKWECAYHVVTVYRIDDDSALIGDLAPEPIRIRADDLANSRARIKSQKNRLLSLAPASGSAPDLAKLVRAGLAACCEELRVPSWKSYRGNFKLDALGVWADRLHGSKDKERWERLFTPGPNLWRGLTGVYDYIENYGTGGGLCRPIFAEFLAEAGATLGDARLTVLAGRYADLGKLWSTLAESALPDAVPPFRKAKKLLKRPSELMRTQGAAATDEMRAIWAQLGELAREAGDCFPLSEAQSAALRAELQQQVRAIHEAEVSACVALAEAATP